MSDVIVKKMNSMKLALSSGANLCNSNKVEISRNEHGYRISHVQNSTAKIMVPEEETPQQRQLREMRLRTAPPIWTHPDLARWSKSIKEELYKQSREWRPPIVSSQSDFLVRELANVVAVYVPEIVYGYHTRGLTVFGRREGAFEVFPNMYHGVGIESYSNGVRHGVAISNNLFRVHFERWHNGQQVSDQSWYPEGMQHGMSEFFNGELHGVGLEWHENGKVKAVYHYVNGKYHGPMLRWGRNGHLSFSLLFVNGRDVGPYIPLQCANVVVAE